MNTENFEFCLSSNSLKNLPLDKYEKNFTFIVNTKRYQTSRVIADLLSPLIRKLHYTDPTISEYAIDMTTMNTNSDENDYFTEFLSLSDFQKSSIEQNRQKFYLHYFYKLGNIDEYFRLQPEYLKTIDIENVLDRLQSFSKMNIEYKETSNTLSSVFGQMIQYASEHFEEVDKEKMKSLPNEIIEEITRNQNLKLNKEDSLLEFILSLCENDHSHSNLFENVLFCNVSEETLEKFVNEFDVDQINSQIFQSICKRFFMNKNKNENENRYLNNCFKPNEIEDFNGILRYLTNKTGGNIHDNGTIEISSNSICSDASLYHPKNSVDYQNNNIYHSKQSKKDAYIRFDFKDRSIQVSSYSIQSAPGNNVHLKNWVIEGSEDGQKWQEIDHRSNNSELNGLGLKSRFDVNNPQMKFYRYLQLRQTGEAWYDWIGFAFIEFYGKLKESNS
ncbi:hypothetical protein M9Y10_025747 [Tritrichomonas musculus]|uniref:F5/8 type C domain-containing protein n=1 Tax=Tritrichomonas musculus TaxID=1915356 RepID=A0ABR2HAE9_9EUKA